MHVALAAAISGLVCGAVATGLVWSGERACDAARGRPTCGGYGVPILLLIVAICFAIGVVLLRVLGVEEAGVSAFFGVTLPLLVILGLLIDYVFDGWMAVALPLMAMVSFVASVYLARALEAADPSGYYDSAAEPDPVVAPDGTADDAAHGEDDIPHYTPGDTDN